MTNKVLLSWIDVVRGKLIESRRYIRSEPTVAKSYLLSTVGDIDYLVKPCGIEGGVMARIGDNIKVALGSILACPDALDGYIEGALWELERSKGRISRIAAQFDTDD